MGKTYRRGGGDDEYAYERMKREIEKRAKKKKKRSYDSVDQNDTEPSDHKW